MPLSGLGAYYDRSCAAEQHIVLQRTSQEYVTCPTQFINSGSAKADTLPRFNGRCPTVSNKLEKIRRDPPSRLHSPFHLHLILRSCVLVADWRTYNQLLARCIAPFPRISCLL